MSTRSRKRLRGQVNLRSNVNPASSRHLVDRGLGEVHCLWDALAARKANWQVNFVFVAEGRYGRQPILKDRDRRVAFIDRRNAEPGVRDDVLYPCLAGISACGAPAPLIQGHASDDNMGWMSRDEFALREDYTSVRRPEEAGRGYPKRESERGDSDAGQSGERPLILTGSNEAARDMQLRSGDHYDEEAGVFMKSLIGLIIFAVMYAISRRF